MLERNGSGEVRQKIDDSRSNFFRIGRVTLDQMVAEFIQEKVHPEPKSKFLEMLEFANERGFASDGVRLTRDEIYSRD